MTSQFLKEAAKHYFHQNEGYVMVVLNVWSNWCILIQLSPCFNELAPLLPKPKMNIQWIVWTLTWKISPGLVSTRVIPATAEIPTPGHSKFMNYNLILLNILFDSGKGTLPSCSVNKIIGAFLLWELIFLPYVVLLHSPLPWLIASNNPTFLQTKNLI